ncbi:MULTISPECIES: BREX-1 system phosphatase PglZ type A [unclassified Mesobacillus]|uniref:BREX-1 system phosphatase PglZ type A n=1 Tax=unclassified Mesobacillus TaxID=2675270 RepID=UPI00203AA8C4|nr:MULTISPECIES: BREX-1 system phosphatase PglZ type A [unclassified Mesobacillus]MCM3122889.1 BREX-1 system phosphatase PglZ type A [Mesobacillus sp. MER 33]MCM3233628.1 BREX-1 system phosphatase PglZ type A [Mesobacillus sp. MER 48]
MNLKEVNRVLQDTFNKQLTEGKKRHIVFWYDEEGEFIEDIDGLNLENIRVWKLTQYNLFATKYELEKNDPHSHFLIYANMAKPNPREDWLLGVYKYSFEFATDKITVIMRDLGVTNDSLRPVFKKYTKFFNNKDRYATFQSYDIQEYTEEKIDIAVLSTLCKSYINNLDEVVKTLFKELNQDDKKAWESIQKFGDEDSFWNLMEKHYYYSLNERSIQDLFIFFTLTNISASLNFLLPNTWTKYISSSPTNCIVLMNQFMNNKTDRLEYNKLAIEIENMVKVSDYIDEWEIKDFIKTDVFQIFDEKIINYISTQLKNDIHQYDSYVDLISERRTLHWYPEFKYEYESLIQAIHLLKKAYDLDFFIRQESPFEMFKEYSENYYKIDTAYRKFYVAFDKLENKERLLSIKEKVDNAYTNWFADELSIKWCNSVEGELRNHWAITGMDQQYDFYKTTIQPYINKGERVFVIISDALRFEAAKELSELLNNERKGSTEIVTMQGVLPSYTDLGMAVLLPHKHITYQDGQVEVDGIRASGIENRNNILQKYVDDSIAIQYRNIIDMNRQELRETISGKRLVYIYHNSIDARGDHAATEREVFDAVEDAFVEIRSLVNHLVNSVSASNIVITTDHGFIYNRNPLHASDKVIKNIDNAIIEKRRFLLLNSDANAELEGTMKFSMNYLLHGDEKHVIVPRGSNRFSVQGAGANYVHGGQMLQEIVIPVIKFKNDRGKSGKNDVSKVEVKLTSISRKITSMITYLDFFQTVKVEDKKKPLRLKIYFADEEGNRLSNENIIIADSKSSKPEERTFKEKFVFKNMTYDKVKKYYLIIEDEEESVENVYDKIAFTIDIAISNDFGF